MKNATKKAVPSAKAVPATGKKESGFYSRPVKRLYKGSGYLIRLLVRAGADTEKILAIVAKKFAGTERTTGPSDVSWNRYMLNKGRYGAEEKMEGFAGDLKAAKALLGGK